MYAVHTHRLRSTPHARARSARLTPAEIVLLALLIVAICVALAVALRDPSADLNTPTTTIRVDSADTLWGLAQRHTAPGRDTAATVDLIRRVNGLTSSELMTGQTLLVPAGEGPTTVARR